MLDVEVAASVAPGAKVAVYFTPNTDQGFLDAITPRCTMRPTSRRDSISWGGPESSWTAQSMTAMDEACQSAAALGSRLRLRLRQRVDGRRDGQQRRLSGLGPHVLAAAEPADANGATIVRGWCGTSWPTTRRNRRRREQRLRFTSWQAKAQVPAAPPLRERGVPDWLATPIRRPGIRFA